MSVRRQLHDGSSAPVRRLRGNLYHCMVDGLLYCVMVGVGESFIPAFVLQLGLGPVAAGLVLTVPVVVGAWLQLLAQVLVRRFGSYVKFVALMAFLQGLMYLPLGAIAVFWPAIRGMCEDAGVGWAAGVLVFATVTLYWVFGLMGGPPWMALCGHLIPERVRGGYFGKRSRYLQAMTLLGLLTHGGVMTLVGPDEGHRLAAFAGLFGFAALMRMGSVWHLLRYTEPEAGPRQEPVFAPKEIGRVLLRGGTGKFLLFAGAAWFAAQIAQPYLNPFMLDVLKQSPIVYSAMLGAWFFGKGVAQPWMGRFATRHGSFGPLLVASIGIVPLPLIWLVTSRVEVLIVLQFVSGVMWGMFELGLTLQQFEATDAKNRTVVIACYTALNETAKTGGSVLGGGMLDAGGRVEGAYAAVFWVSAGARALAALLLGGLLRGRGEPPERG